MGSSDPAKLRSPVGESPPEVQQLRYDECLFPEGLMTSLVPALKNGLRSLVAIRQLNLSRKAALLTFDDGPHPEVTQKVLNLLRKYSSRAVFFVVGSRIPCAPHLLQEILAEGHIIGSVLLYKLDRILPWLIRLDVLSRLPVARKRVRTVEFGG